MNLGEKLKLLRQEKGWNQPELAEQLGIEQSYLSKLENGKAIPSADTFQRILEAFDLTVEEMLKGLDSKFIRKQLQTLPQVAGHITNFQSRVSHIKKWWILSSAAAVVCGITASLLAMQMAFGTKSYEYRSEEIVPRGPNGEVFTTLSEFVDFTVAPIGQQLLSSGLNDRDRIQQLDREIENVFYQYSNLKFTDYFTTAYRRGQFFSSELTSTEDWDILVPSGISNGATRTYTLIGESDIRNPAFRLVIVLGGFLIFAGLFGFITERMVLRSDISKYEYA